MTAENMLPGINSHLRITGEQTGWNIAENNYKNESKKKLMNFMWNLLLLLLLLQFNRMN